MDNESSELGFGMKRVDGGMWELIDEMWKQQEIEPKKKKKMPQLFMSSHLKKKKIVWKRGAGANIQFPLKKKIVTTFSE
mgnify:CR=1 FL=1